MATDFLKQRYRDEIERLDAEHEDLERMWTQVPRFTLFVLLAPVAGYVWGWGAGVVALLVSAALVGTRAYLIAVRKTENRWNRDKLRSDLSEQDEPAQGPARAPERTSALRLAHGIRAA